MTNTVYKIGVNMTIDADFIFCSLQKRFEKYTCWS